ncbi:MAG: FitA-like ribbon-helix-helix domain-containing protein [Opitutales bacterium]
MKSIHIRNVPEHTLEALKTRAKSHHRSLQHEIHHLLEAASKLPLPSSKRSLELCYAESGIKEGSWNRAAIYEDSSEGR